MICRACGNKWEKIQELSFEDLTAIDGLGDIMAGSYREFFSSEENKKTVADLLAILDLDETEEKTGNTLAGMTFVITGSLDRYENRDALKADIEKAGGKVAGSVSAKTSYLINNDVNSSSGKNKKARELGIPVINEEEAIEMLNGNK